MVITFINSKRLSTDTYEYPYWTEIFGNVLTSTILVAFFTCALYVIIDTKFVQKKVTFFQI